MHKEGTGSGLNLKGKFSRNPIYGPSIAIDLKPIFFFYNCLVKIYFFCKKQIKLSLIVMTDRNNNNNQHIEDIEANIVLDSV